jgi:hypothetical protein
MKFELAATLDCSPDSRVEAAGVDLRLRCDCEDHERGRTDATVDRPPTAATSTRSKLAQPLARLALNRAGVWAPKPRAHRLELLNGVEHRDLLLRRPRAVALSFRLRMPHRVIGKTRILCGSLRLFRDPSLAVRFRLRLSAAMTTKHRCRRGGSPSGTTGP